MDTIPRRFVTAPGFLAPLALGVTLLAGSLSAVAQVPSDCTNICNQKYALCIAASCNASGQCGQCNATNGSCGYCYVFEGQSCSYGKPCSELQPSGSTVYSTYSEVLSTTFGFKVMTCPHATAAADCMDGKCTLTGKTVTLKDSSGKTHQVPTAICNCTPTKGAGSTLGGQCNTAANCSAIWSTASTQFLSGMPQCSAGAPATKKP